MLVGRRCEPSSLVLTGAVKKCDGALQVDIEWYLAQQILPPITRLCNVIDGTDSGQIASCLGLDPSIEHGVPARSLTTRRQVPEHDARLDS